VQVFSLDGSEELRGFVDFSGSLCLKSQCGVGSDDIGNIINLSLNLNVSLGGQFSREVNSSGFVSVFGSKSSKDRAILLADERRFKSNSVSGCSIPGNLLLFLLRGEVLCEEV